MTRLFSTPQSIHRLSGDGYTHRCRPGACPRDPTAPARSDALTGPARPLERSGQWVPATSAGTTALEAAGKSLFCIGLAALLLAVATTVSSALSQDNQVGLVKVVDGQAFALRDDGSRARGVGAPIDVEAVMGSGAGSRGLHFTDE